jgi:hypothetical protein
MRSNGKLWMPVQCGTHYFAFTLYPVCQAVVQYLRFDFCSFLSVQKPVRG